MHATQLQRTDNGYQTKQVAVTQQDLSPRQAQLAVFAMGHAMPYKQVGAQMGITEGSVQQLAKQLFYKLGVHNKLEATNELLRRGLLKHLCVMVFISLTAIPQANADEKYRRPPRQHRVSRIKGSSRSAWIDLLNKLQPQ